MKNQENHRQGVVGSLLTAFGEKILDWFISYGLQTSPLEGSINQIISHRFLQIATV